MDVMILCRTVIQTQFRIPQTLFGCPDPFHFISRALAQPPVILFHWYHFYYLCSTYICRPVYIVASSPVCATTRLPTLNPHFLSLQAIPLLPHHGRTLLGVQVSNTHTTRPFCPCWHSTVGFLPSLWAGHGSDNGSFWETKCTHIMLKWCMYLWVGIYICDMYIRSHQSHLSQCKGWNTNTTFFAQLNITMHNICY